MRIKNVSQTCWACPSQWEGSFTDGSALYIRYRWGYLSVEKDGEEIYGEQVGDGFDGYMELPEVLELTGMVLDGDVPQRRTR